VVKSLFYLYLLGVRLGALGVSVVNESFERQTASTEANLKSKHASAFLFPQDIRVHSQLHTPYGMFACEPYQRIDRAAPAEAIAAAVRIALQHAREQAEMPPGSGKDIMKAYLVGMGVRSNAELQRKSRYVGIEQAADLAFHPTHNGGTSGDGKGFQPIPGVDAIRVPITAAPADVAAALLRAFELCTSIYD